MCPSVPSSQLTSTRGSCSSSVLPREDRSIVSPLSGYGKGAGGADLPSTLTVSLHTLTHDLHGQHQLSTPKPSLSYFGPLCLIQPRWKQPQSSLVRVPHASTTPCTEGRSAVSAELWGGKLGQIPGMPPLHLTTPFVPSPDRCADTPPSLIWF